MRDIIINILVFVLFFNLLMIIFPEGRTQKYCRLVVKLFLLMYIATNVIFKGTISLDNLVDFNVFNNTSTNYEREIDLADSEKQFIMLINDNLYKGEEIIKNIKLSFTKDMELNVTVFTNQLLDCEKEEALRLSISQIFNIGSEGVKITF